MDLPTFKMTKPEVWQLQNPSCINQAVTWFKISMVDNIAVVQIDHALKIIIIRIVTYFSKDYMFLFKFILIHKVNSSFASIYISTVSIDIKLKLPWVVWGCEKGLCWVAWPLINIARIGAKVRVGLEKLFYKSMIGIKWRQLLNSYKCPLR